MVIGTTALKSRVSARKKRTSAAVTLAPPGKIAISKFLPLKHVESKQQSIWQKQPDQVVLDETIRKALHRISTHSSLTPFRRLVYRTLLSVPRGSWTTYAALAAHLSSSARAIGNAMRTNPFAPDVPCHRVLASDRTIGGYKGAWGNGGSYAEEKTKLLVGEGIIFDNKGVAAGEVFKGFVDMGTLLAKE